MLLTDKEGFDFQMIYYNADGNESSMCGNGGRCITAFARQMGIVKDTYHFLAIDGPHDAAFEGDNVRLKMSKPFDFYMYDNNTYKIQTGSPHYVKLMDTDIAQVDVVKEGKAVRYNAEFQQDGINVNFVNILNKGHLKVRTYERGVEDETYSCGTGVTACAYTYIIWNNAVQRVEIETKGGNLSVEVQHFHTDSEAVWLIGPATFVFEGTIELHT